MGLKWSKKEKLPEKDQKKYLHHGGYFWLILICVIIFSITSIFVVILLKNDIGHLITTYGSDTKCFWVGIGIQNTCFVIIYAIDKLIRNYFK